MIKARNLLIEPCAVGDVRAFIEEHHYSRSINGVKVMQCFAVRVANRLVGAVLFGAMSTTAWKRFGKTEWEVVELRRLVLVDEAGRNSESRVIGATLRWLTKHKPEVRVVVSYADPAHGHVGTIYRASNFQYLGTTSSDKAYITPCGKIYHSRALRTKDDHGEYKPFVKRLRALKESGALTEISLPAKHCFIYTLRGRVIE